MKNAILRFGLLALAVCGVLCMNSGCDQQSSGSGPQDPDRASLISVSAPKHLCLGVKAPFQIAFRVEQDSNSSATSYAWYEISRATGEYGAVSSGYTAFDSSQYVVFNNISLGSGAYFVRCGLSFTSGVDYSSYYQLPSDSLPFIYVDSLNCTYRTFSFDVYHQDFYDYMPKGLSDLQIAYDSALIALDPHVVATPLPVEELVFTENQLYAYAADHTDVSLGYDFHAFAIQSVRHPNGMPLPRVFGGTLRLFNHEPITFTCVLSLQRYFVHSDHAKAISSTSAHELGHFVAGLSDLCARPDSHIVGQCLMADLDYDAATNDLILICGSGPLDQERWPYLDAFCDSCIAHLRSTTW